VAASAHLRRAFAWAEAPKKEDGMARRGGGGGGFSSGIGIGCGIAVGCIIAIGVVFLVMGGSCMGLALFGSAPEVDDATPDRTEPAPGPSPSPAPDGGTDAPDETEPGEAAPPGAAPAEAGEAGGAEAEPEAPAEPQGRPVRVVLKSGATLTGRIVAETNRTVTLKAGRGTMKLQRGEILRIEEQGEE